MSHEAPITPAIRHDGWTPERRARFLDHLAAHGDVRAACGRAGMSREAAYRLRRRDALFARAWAAGLVLAQEASFEVLGSRAIDGIEEDVWYRGEVVGTRRKYDTRLLLAHIARLDRAVEQQDGLAAEDAERFDELLAANAGIGAPDELGDDGSGLAMPREDYGDAEADAVEADLEYERETRQAEGEDTDEDGGEDGDEDGDEEDYDAFSRRCDETARAARIAGLARWDAWFGDACARIDAMIAGQSCGAGSVPCTVSTVSTSQAHGGTGAPPLSA